MRGAIVFQGRRGNAKSKNKSTSKVNMITSLATLATFKDVVDPYTLCNIARWSVSDFGIGTTSIPAADANIDEKATIYFKDPDTNNTHSFSIPAWDIATYPLDTTSGNDMIATADVSAIVAAINVATGKSYTAMYGTHTKSV